MGLPCYTSKTPLTFESVKELGLHAIETDWFGKTVKPARSFALAMDPAGIWFYAECNETPVVDRRYGIGKFAEGLWNFDVAELFVCGDDRKSYQEFNLSPTGAWWTAAFSDYRSRRETLLYQKELPECYSDIGENRWVAAVKIPKSFFSVTISFTESTKANVTFVKCKPEIQYLSWAKTTSGSPDFHKTQGFEALEFKAA